MIGTIVHWTRDGYKPRIFLQFNPFESLMKNNTVSVYINFLCIHW